MSGEQNVNSVLEDMRKNGKALCYTKGTSMLPMLKEGRDISVLVPPDKNLNVGDVVLFIRPLKDKELVLHRIVKKVSDDRFLIRGDNTFFDEPVKREYIIATLEGFFRKGRYINCEKSKGYRLYTVLKLRFFFIKKFFFKTVISAGARIKNDVFHLNNLHFLKK